MASSDRTAGRFLIVLFIRFDKKGRYFDLIIIFFDGDCGTPSGNHFKIELYVGDRSPWLSGKVLSMEHGTSLSCWFIHSCVFSEY